MAQILTPFEDNRTNKKRPKKKSPQTDQAKEFHGLLQGIVVDGEVNLRETEFLKKWLGDHINQLDEWPSAPMLLRLNRYLDDGILDIEEQRELIELLKREVKLPKLPRLGSIDGGIHFDKPESPLPIEGMNYCLTGTFRSGNQKHLESLLRGLGAIPCNTPLQCGCIVVVGSHGYPDGKVHNKVAKATKYRSERHEVLLISERTWWETFGQHFT